MSGDNLPVPTHVEPTGPTGVPLSATPTEALSFALGWIASQPVQAKQYGGVTALVEELMRRSVWDLLLAHMPPALAASIQTLYRAHRGQRWDRSGRTGWRST